MTRRKFDLLIGVSLFALWIGAPTAAQADPVSAAVAVWSAVTTAATWLAGSSLLALAVRTVGLSLLSQALSKTKSTAAAVGIKSSTSTGGATPQTFIMGLRATPGHLIAPVMSYGADGKTPNAYLTYVMAVGCMPRHALSRLIINDAYVLVASTTSIIGGSTVAGYALGGDYAGNAWIVFHDGTQTTADPLLMQKFASYPDRPWSSDMIGYGQSYAVMVFKYNRELYTAPPTVKFEMNGIPLYDPRYDSTVGGSGAQRWGTPSTYAPTVNPATMIYNIHRGITMPDGFIWGGEAEAEDLPLDNWFAAMNACDVSITLTDGSTEPAFAAGLEISLSDQPADIMDKLETACGAQQVEIGGVWKIRVGGVGLPVYFFTDDDILVDHDQSHDLFPGLDDTHNGIQATHPLPSALWDTTDAPAIYNDDLEALDGNRRLPADLALDPVYSPTQAQRVMTEYIREERRFGRHSLSFGPYASMVETLDAVSWTSANEGYENKVFEVSQAAEDLLQLNVSMSLRERDAADAVPPTVYLPWVASSPGSQLPEAQSVPGWTVTGTAIKDSSSTNRRPAIALEWDGSDMPDVRGLMWEIRLKTSGDLVTSGTASEITADGVVVSEGILSSMVYQARGQLIVDRATSWTTWTDVTTPNVALIADDVAYVSGVPANTVITRIADAQDAAEAAMSTAVDGIADIQGQLDAFQASVGTSLGAIATTLTDHTNRIAATENGLTAEISDRSALATQIRGGYTGTDPAALSSGLSYNERTARSSADATNATNTAAVAGGLATANSNITANGDAINALSIRMTTAEGYISSHAASITSLSSGLTALNGTVSGQGTSLSSLTTTVSALSGTVSSISTNLTAVTSTVGGHTSSITSLFTTTATQTDQLTNLYAKTSVLLGVDTGSGVKVVGWTLNNDGATGNMDIQVDHFALSSGTSGARLEFSDMNLRIYNASGNLIVREGVWTA